jgi:excisionase family DNA binding protein
MPPLNTAQAAAKLKISPGRVRALIAAKRLPAVKFGRDYMIEPADLARVRVRKPGRPKTKK